MTTTDPIPFDDAIKSVLDRVIAPTPKNTAQLARVPAAVRARAFFSSRVMSAQLLQDFQDSVASIVAGKTNLATERVKLKDAVDALGYRPEEGTEGGLEDLGSNRRLNVMLNTNVQMARGFGQFLQANSEGALMAFPAQELVRFEARNVPREWPEIWDDAADELGDDTSATDAGETGRMVALVNDPIWLEISDFDQPYPPFKFNSGMGVRPIDRDEAIELGVMDEADPAPEPQQRDFNQDVAASVEDMSQAILSALMGELQDMATLVENKLVMKKPAADVRQLANERLQSLDVLLGNSNPNQPRDQSGRWVREFKVDVEPRVFRALGIPQANVFADGTALQHKHPEYFQDGQEAREHVEHVFAKPTHILPGNLPDHRLIVRASDAGDHKAAVLEVQLRGGKYRVKSAYEMTESQLRTKIGQSAGQVVRLGNSRVDRPWGETPSRRLSVPRDTPPADQRLHLTGAGTLRQRATGRLQTTEVFV